MLILYYRKFRIYYEECSLISVESIKYGIEHIRLNPKVPVPLEFLLFLVDKLIYDSEESYNRYFYETLSASERAAVIKFSGGEMVQIYGGNNIFSKF